jgi:hypothetical protein
MGRIYQNARCVVVWLGYGDPLVEYGFSIPPLRLECHAISEKAGEIIDQVLRQRAVFTCGLSALIPHRNSANSAE